MTIPSLQTCQILKHIHTQMNKKGRWTKRLKNKSTKIQAATVFFILNRLLNSLQVIYSE